eukprot:gene10753-17835_t
MEVIRGLVPSCRDPIASAWCPSTNLIALASSMGPRPKAESGTCVGEGSEAGLKLHISLVNPQDMENCCTLEGNINASDGPIVSIDWSPVSCRRALLVATTSGRLFAWTQAPHKEFDPPPPRPPSAPPSSSSLPPLSMRAINQWYGHVMRDEGEVQSPSADDNRILRTCSSTLGTTHQDELKPIVYAGWVAAPELCVWSTARLSSAEAGRCYLVDQFLPNVSCGAIGGANGGRHWLRPTQLAAAVVGLGGSMQLYCSVVGKVAVVKASDPSSVQVFQVFGNPAVQSVPGLPPSLLMCSETVGVITIANHLPDGFAGAPFLVRNVQLNGAYNAGASVLVSVEAAGRSLVLHFNQAMMPADAGSQFSSGQPHWHLKASFQLPPPSADSATTSLHITNMALSADGSKLILTMEGGLAHVLDAISLVLLSTLRPPPDGSGGAAPEEYENGNSEVGSGLMSSLSHVLSPDGNSKGEGLAQQVRGITTTCMSPNSCMACVAYCPPYSPGDASETKTSSRTGTRLTIYASPEIHPGTNDLAKGSETKVANMCTAEQLDALRIGWSLMRQSNPWDAVQRTLAHAKYNPGVYRLARTVELLDSMVHTSEYNQRTWFSQRADRAKMLLFRAIPSQLTTVLMSDITARQLVSFLDVLLNLTTILMSCITARQLVGFLNVLLNKTVDYSTNNQPKINPEFAPVIAQWEEVAFEFFVFLMTCLKRWLTLKAPGSPEAARLSPEELQRQLCLIPCIRLLADAHFIRKIVIFFQLWGSRTVKGRPAPSGILFSSALLKTAIMLLNSICREPEELGLTNSWPEERDGDSIPVILPSFNPTLRLAQEKIDEEYRSWRQHSPVTSSLSTESTTTTTQTPSLLGSRRGAEQAQLKRKRWSQLHSAALSVGGDSAVGGSTVLAVAAKHYLPMLDSVLGRRRSWDRVATSAATGGCNVIYETVDGSFITAVPTMNSDAATSSMTKTLGPHLPHGANSMYRPWLMACPINGAQWKRVCLGNGMANGP